MPTLFQLTANAYLDFLSQLSALVRDPINYGVDVPRGDGHPVLLIPGFTAGDWSLGTLARWLRRIGYRPYLSGIDLNVGCPRRKHESIAWRVEKIARETNDRVTIIGHSLGGVIGRAIAVTNPAQVRQVIALGSPVRAGWMGVQDDLRPMLQAINVFWQSYSGGPENCGTLECPCGLGDTVGAAVPPQSRFAAIYTRRDEVVQWQACIDDGAPSHEVDGLHASLIVNRYVYRILGALLSARGAECAAA